MTTPKKRFPRETRIYIRVTAEERPLFQQAAAHEDRSLSEWARIILHKAARQQRKQGQQDQRAA